jgi:hypothetical protein
LRTFSASLSGSQVYSTTPRTVASDYSLAITWAFRVLFAYKWLPTGAPVRSRLDKSGCTALRRGGAPGLASQLGGRM